MWSVWGLVVAVGLVLPDLDSVDVDEAREEEAADDEVDDLVVGSDGMVAQAISLPLMRARQGHV